MDRWAWWATVHGVTKARIWLKQLTLSLSKLNHLSLTGLPKFIFPNNTFSKPISPLVPKHVMTFFNPCSCCILTLSGYLYLRANLSWVQSVPNTTLLNILGNVFLDILISQSYHLFRGQQSNLSFLHIPSVQSLSHVRFFVTPWIAARQASLFITNSRSSRKLMSIKSVMPPSHLILCRPLLLLPPIPPSIRVISLNNAYFSFSKFSRNICKN